MSKSGVGFTIIGLFSAFSIAFELANLQSLAFLTGTFSLDS